MRRKVFWISLTMLSLLADLILPFVWGIACTVPLVFLCWWIAYKSEWFD